MATKFCKTGVIKALLTVTLCACTLTGCGWDPNGHNQANGKLDPPGAISEKYISNASYIATLPDGRHVYQFNVQHYLNSMADHVYFVTGPDGCNGTITVNRLEPYGKTHVNTTKVMIDDN